MAVISSPSASAVVDMPTKKSSALISRRFVMTVAPRPSTAQGWQAAGSLWATEPPSVPRARTWRSPICAARSASAGMAACTSALRATSTWRVIAPMTRALPARRMPASSSMPSRAMTCPGLVRGGDGGGWPGGGGPGAAAWGAAGSARGPVACRRRRSAGLRRPGWRGLRSLMRTCGCSSGFGAWIGLLDGLPYAVGRCRHIEVAHAQRAQRVEYGVDHRRRRAYGPGLAATLGAQRAVRAGRAYMAQFEIGEVVRARHRVVHEAAGEQLAGLAVVDAVFHQRLPYALRHPAMHLAFDDHRVDDGAEVVDRSEPVHPRGAGGGVDLDLADVGAGGEGEVGRVVERGFVQARFELVERVVVRHVGGQRHLGERDFLVRAAHAELTIGEVDVGVAGFHQVRSDFFRLGFDLVQRFHDGSAAHADRARAVGAHAEGH